MGALKHGVVLVAMLGCAPPIRGQYPDPSQQDVTIDGFGADIASFLAPFLLPKILHDTHSLRQYIKSSEFGDIRIRKGDLAAVDGMFSEATFLSWNNPYAALWISFLATMDHHRFGIDLPIIGPILWFPLTSEFEVEFQERVRALPRILYPDSPRSGAGDRDKLQHFFGSALLACLFESQEGAGRVGEAIEAGEQQFIVEGAFDERDLRANQHGQMFGLSLLSNPAVLPSEFLQLVLATNYGVHTGGPDLSNGSFHSGEPPGVCQELQSEER